jgi:hypothetical protein
VTGRGGKFSNIKDKNCIYVEHTHSLYSTKFCSSAQDIKDSDDNVTNVSNGSTHSYKARAIPHILNQSEFIGASFCLNIKDTIADSNAMQIFAIEGTPIINKCRTAQSLKVYLADGRQVMSTHVCDIFIEHLPTILTGHIVSNLSIATLFGIHALTDAGCNVIFGREKCTVRYNGKTILCSGKDPARHIHRGIIKVPTVSTYVIHIYRLHGRLKGRGTVPPNHHALLEM